MKRLIIISILICLSIPTFAGNSDWREVQSVALPSTTPVYSGTTKAGNAKYWIVIANNTQVSISQANVEKLKKDTAVIELVKWTNLKTGKYRYSTRQRKPKVEETPNIDLTKLF